MPVKPPRLCPCGVVTPSGQLCKCEAKAAAERKARHDLRRPSSSQRGYSGAWEKARKAYLERHKFCRYCGAAATVVDHIEAHKGDRERFWDRSNWQPLCAPCHNSAKQRAERKQRKGD